MRYLSPRMYEHVLVRGLRELGLSDDQAMNVIRARYPMDAGGVVSEGFGRGLSLNLDDVLEVIREEAHGDEVDAERALFDAEHVEFIIAKLVESDRAALTPAGQTFQADDSWVKRRFDPAETN